MAAATIDERGASDATVLEAFETAQPASTSWTADDRVWADRVALEALGSDAAPAAFVVGRARHALQRLAPRERIVAQWLREPLWRARWIVVVAVLAFGVGVLADHIGNSQRINLLAPPFWGVLLWNAVVYLALVAGLLARLMRRAPRAAGPLLRATRSLLQIRRRLPSAPAGGSAVALARFVALWGERGARLALLRAETVLHAGAGALGLGLVAGLYARGLVLDYRAGWESTFLSPGVAHALVTTVLAPAAQLSGIALPDAAAFAALRSAHGDTGGGAPAAPWIHLIALTLLLFVVVPRVLLGLFLLARSERIARRFPLPLESPYFQRLLRLQRGAAARLCVFPYGSTPSPQATLAMRAIAAELFGARVAFEVAPTVGFAGEDDALLAADPALTHALALFDASATPEAENQGRFVARLLSVLPPGAALVAIVDEAAFAERFGALPERMAQRRDAWRAWGDALDIAVVFVELAAAGVAAALPAMQAAFARPARAMR
ncbi:MAG TPA: DUF2868 domain-containing protein [Caldimonas sp.]